MQYKGIDMAIFLFLSQTSMPTIRLQQSIANLIQRVYIISRMKESNYPDQHGNTYLGEKSPVTCVLRAFSRIIIVYRLINYMANSNAKTSTKSVNIIMLIIFVWCRIFVFWHLITNADGVWCGDYYDDGP